MDINKLKLAAYLDEAADDPASACKVLHSCNITHAVLRRMWANNICTLSDHACLELRNTLNKFKINTTMIITNVGYVPINELMSTQLPLLKRSILLAKYFNAPMIRIGFGTKSNTIQDKYIHQIKQWIEHALDECFINNLTPLFEVNHTSIHYKSIEVLELFKNYKKLRLLFDPAELITHQHLNPYTKYWTLLKSYVSAIDVHDCKIGVGFKPIGYGDCQFKHIMADTTLMKYNGWWFLEPSLGRRHGSAISKQETFKMAYDALQAFIKWADDQTSSKKA